MSEQQKQLDIATQLASAQARIAALAVELNRAIEDSSIAESCRLRAETERDKWRASHDEQVRRKRVGNDWLKRVKVERTQYRDRNKALVEGLRRLWESLRMTLPVPRGVGDWSVRDAGEIERAFDAARTLLDESKGEG